MTNERNSVILAPANPVKTVAPVKEETEMLRATEKITALYCRLSQEDERLPSKIKIYVGTPDKSSGKRRQSIHICYDLIGFIPLSELMEQEMA